MRPGALGTGMWPKRLSPARAADLSPHLAMAGKVLGWPRSRQLPQCLLPGVPAGVAPKPPAHTPGPGVFSPSALPGPTWEVTTWD